jgi:hypothetical protein
LVWLVLHGGIDDLAVTLKILAEQGLSLGSGFVDIKFS